MFLRVFFGYMALKMDNSRDDANLANPIVEVYISFHLREFADYLFSNFFVPSESSARPSSLPSRLGVTSPKTPYQPL